MMKNCRRQSDKKPLASLFALLLLMMMCSPSASHFIQIDHNEFRASGFPRPAPMPPIDQLPQHHVPLAKELTPAELMSDLTNDLTYRILHLHSILNRNNFAFSPTALMSVLLALYEGSAGRSSLELHNVLQLPNNRDVVRVGYRDIHRRLRTYFFGSDNPLKGLSLNKDNVTITRDYETVLMFYGYDLGVDMISSTMAPTTTTMPTTMDAKTTPAMDLITTTIQPETTTVTEMPKETTIQSEATTQPSSTTTATETTTSTTTTTESPTTEKPTTAMTTTEEASSTTEEPEPTTLIASSTTEIPTTTAMEIPTTTEPVTEAPTTTIPPGESEAAELVSSFVAEEVGPEPFQRIQKARVSRLPSGKLQAPPPPAYLPSARNGASMRRLPRSKRHLFGFKELDASLFVTLFKPQPVHHNLFSISGPASGPAFSHITNEYDVEVEPHFLSTSEAKQNYNTDVISHVFYLGNQQIVHTTFKVYNAVLYYKYFDNMKMSVLELELDTPEYNLMILLPDFHTDLVTAAASLRLGPTLRLMRKQLKPRWVQAIIPDFKLVGTMFLTNDMQNMGICDIFEPNRADFRPMTDEKGIYVKHIEQSINVNIRTHPINQLKRNYGAQTQPIQISVNHPFLFFIIDRDVDVAVMAGRVLNPLNVRIQ